MKRMMVVACAAVGFGCLLGGSPIPSGLSPGQSSAALQAADNVAADKMAADNVAADSGAIAWIPLHALVVQTSTPPPVTTEKATRDKEARDKAASDKAVSDKAVSDKEARDKEARAKAARDGGALDKAASGQAASDEPTAKPSALSRRRDTSKGDSKATDAAPAVTGKPSVGKSDAAAEGDEEQKFVRTTVGDKGKPVMLQTAIVTYRATEGAYSDAQVDLIGAIHIADRSYFKKLNELFKGYDALLYEMVAEPDAAKQVRSGAKDRSAVSAMQSGMKEMLGLSFQLDEVDYSASNFVHADMNPEEFTQSLSERREGMMQFVMRSMGSSLAMQGSRKGNDFDVLSALFATNRELALKRVLAVQIEQMDGQLAAISGDDGKSTLITERNAKALQVLKRELDAGKKKIGIFYGAGHFRHMGQELDTQFHMQPIKTQWLDAWDMK